MRLTDGNYIYFYSGTHGGLLNPGYAILNGSDLYHVLARSDSALFNENDYTWARGVSPWTCNVPTSLTVDSLHHVAGNVFALFLTGSFAHLSIAYINVNITTT